MNNVPLIIDQLIAASGRSARTAIDCVCLKVLFESFAYMIQSREIMASKAQQGKPGTTEDVEEAHWASVMIEQWTVRSAVSRLQWS
jgi:hypothetical protein